MVKISVVIPCHNIEGYLPRCLDSILHQTFQDFEVLIMENFSTDGTQAVGEKYAKTDGRFKVFVLDKKGVSNARNEGVKMAAGEFIAFVDGDDYVSENYLEELYKGMLAADDIDISIVPYREYYSDKKIHAAGYNFKPRIVRAGDGGGMVAGKRLFVGYHVVWTTLLRKNFIINNGLLFIGAQGEDTLFIHEAQLLSRAVHISDKALYTYIHGRPSQATAGDKATMLTNILETSIRLVKLFDKYGLDDDYKCIAHKIAGIKFVGSDFAGTDICKFDKDKADIILKKFQDYLLSFDLHPNVCTSWQIKWYGYFKFWLKRGHGYRFIRFMRMYRNVICRPFHINQETYPNFFYKKSNTIR